MNKITKISGSIFFIFILMFFPNIQATEFQIVKDDIEKQFEENFFQELDIFSIDLWDLLEFLHFLIITLINFFINIIRTITKKIVMLLLSPFILIYYIIWLFLMIMFPH